MSLSQINTRVGEDAKPLQELVTSIVDTHCKELDEYMARVDEVLSSGKNLPSDALKNILLNINSLLYRAGTGLEKATVKESMAKMIREEKFNQSYNDAEGTMGDKKATASLESQEEELVRVCYTNAVKLYQHKIDIAKEMAGAIKKILTLNIAEMELSRTGG